MRLIGVYGGTFDPIHYAHLRVAEEVAEQLGLAEVRFVPAARPNLRGEPSATPAQRARMVELAIAGNPAFVLERCELERAGVSYTVDTLEHLCGELGSGAMPVVVLGADAFARLTEWSRWERLFDLAHIAVVARPGVAIVPERWSAALQRYWNARHSPAPAALAEAEAGRIVAAATRLLEISASEIRERLRRGASVRYLLPESVLDYIRSQSLYLAGGR
ncbi:MAG: nicotinate-nucleotide adenylyltransferase [Pseudomonadota bacterium]